MAARQQIRYHKLDPEAYKNATRDVVDRLLMDNAMDEVCVLDSVRDRLDPETYATVKRALGQIAARGSYGAPLPTLLWRWAPPPPATGLPTMASAASLAREAADLFPL